MSDAPISEYALLSDCHGAALVHRSGTIDWLCMPRFDAPAVFARLLDERAGSWAIRPVDDFSADRRYLDRSMVLETTFRTESGTAVLTDALDIGTDEAGHNLGSGAANAVLRQIECREGAVEIHIDYRP
ncbi:MAG: trehalase-like domain-containing protein, partial [Bradymonadaceae bacterium]